MGRAAFERSKSRIVRRRTGATVASLDGNNEGENDQTLRVRFLVVFDWNRRLHREQLGTNQRVSAFVRHRGGEHEVGSTALRTGIELARGDIVDIQEADLEYDPNEYLKRLALTTSGKADVAYGYRFRGGESARVLYFWHSQGNKFLTLLSNMLTDLNLTDMETCYKMFRKDVLDRIKITENRFGFEPEITAKISHLNPPPAIYEVGISYTGRTYVDGKKIGWKDGVRAFYCIVRYNLFR